MNQLHSRGRMMIARLGIWAPAVLVSTVALSASVSAALITSTWIGPVNGSWGTVSNWSPVGVPQNGADVFDVIIDENPRQASGVILTGGFTIQSLWITGSDTLTIGNASFLRLAGGSFINDGVMNLASVGNTTELMANANLVLGGIGSVDGSNTQANRILASNPSIRLTQLAGHTIRGSLNLGSSQMVLTNSGEIRADASSGLTVDLTDGAGLNFNGGVMRSTNAATLSLLNSSIDNTGGLIEAGSGSFVTLNGFSVLGGTLRDADGSGSGAVRNITASTLENVTIQGPFVGANATNTFLRGTIDVQGSLVLDSVGNSTDVIVQTSPFTLAGVGETVASNTQANRFYGVNGNVQVVIAPEHTVRGSLGLGSNQMRLDNQGEIRADASSGLTVDLTDGAGLNFNSGVMRSTSGATLALLNSSINNTGGLIEAGNGSFVTLNGFSVLGGTLRDADGGGSGAVRTITSATLEDVTIQGPFVGANATTTFLRGTIDVQGSLVLDSVGNTTDVIVQTSPFTLDGVGETVASNTQANRFYGVNGNVQVVVAPEHTVRGSLGLGSNQMRLDNQGEIRADVSSGLTVDLTDGAGLNFNSGVMRATSGATLAMQNSSINNTGGLIEAGNGSFVTLNGFSVLGGTLRDADGSGSGAVRTITSATLENVTIQGPFVGANATTTFLRGTIDVQGSLVLGSIGNITDVIVQTSPFTLAGVGETVASNTQANRFYGVNGNVQIIVAPEHTLRGSLNLGTNQSSVVNLGTILADASSGMTIDPTDGPGFVNSGLLHLTAGNVSLATGTFDNSGTVMIDAGRTLSRTGVYSQSAGETSVDGSLNASGGIALAGGTLEGNGSVISPVTNSGGAVAPGTSAGVLSFTSGYTQQSGGTLSIEIGGTTVGSGYDRLAITGNAALAGTLTVARINGFTPAPTDVFTILTCTGTRSGTFRSVTSCDSVSVTYTANAVLVQFLGVSGIVGDINNDGLVNGADLALVLGNWGPCNEACCVGDLDGNSIINGADLAIVLGNWAP